MSSFVVAVKVLKFFEHQLGLKGECFHEMQFFLKELFFLLDLSIFGFELPVSGGKSINNLFELVNLIEEKDGDVGGRY